MLISPIQLRRDLGGVQYTPTILVVFFSDDRTLRAKYEGLREIQQGMSRYYKRISVYRCVLILCILNDNIMSLYVELVCIQMSLIDYNKNLKLKVPI